VSAGVLASSRAFARVVGYVLGSHAQPLVREAPVGVLASSRAFARVVGYVLGSHAQPLVREAPVGVLGRSSWTRPPAAKDACRSH